VIFGLSVAQAAATLAAVMVGHAIGLFDETVVNGTIMMILATCILGPWVVARHAKKMAQASRVVDDDQEHQRILVPFSDVRLAKPSVDLALLIRGGGSSPLYPLFVAQDGEGVMDRVAAGENMLSEIASIASSADVLTQALTRVDSNISQAIARARKEMRITDVVATWNGQVSAEDRIFGSVLDQLVCDKVTSLCVTYQPQALNITTRVLLLVPPHAEQDPSFDRGVALTKRVAAAVGAPVVVMMAGSEEKELFKRIKRVRPSTKVLSKPLESWDLLVPSLADRLGPHDLVVLLGVRPDSPAFAQELRALPRRLVSRFPNNDLLVVYASTLKLAVLDEAEPEGDAAEPALVASEHIILSLDDLPLAGVFARIAAYARASWPNEHPLDQSVHASIIERARELAPGVVLLRHKDRHLDESSLWLGVSRVGVEEERWDSKVHLFFVLFGPDGRDPIEVTETIHKVRALAKKSQAVDKIRFATDLKTVREALREHGLTDLETSGSSEEPAPPSEGPAAVRP